MNVMQRMIRLPSGKRTGIKLDEVTWQAIERAATASGMTWQQWCAKAAATAGDSGNTTAAIRAAAIDSLLTETIIADRAEQFSGLQSVGMMMSGQCGDKDFLADLRLGHIDFVCDCVGFKLHSGIDVNGNVCYWIENGLRNASHIIVRTPFRPERWNDALEACGEG